MSDSVRWLGAAFGVAWLLLGAYIVRLWRAQRDLRRRLEELDRREG